MKSIGYILIFTFFFGYILQWNTNNIPYPLYVLSGLLGWNFFSYIVQSGTTSIQESAHIIKKIYFPKSILPLSKIIVALDMVIETSDKNKTILERAAMTCPVLLSLHPDIEKEITFNWK